MTPATRIGPHLESEASSMKLAALAGLLGAGVVAAPLAFGATAVWAYGSLQVLVAMATVLWAITVGTARRRLLLPWAVVILSVVQLLPLSEPLLGWIAPQCAQARWKVQALVDAPVRGEISVNSAKTTAALRRVLMLTLVIVIAIDVARVDRCRQWLIRCVAGVGAAVLLLGLLVGPGPERKALGLLNRDGHWKYYKNPLLTGFTSEGMGYADRVTVGGIHYISNSPVTGAAIGAMINANHFAACVGLTLPIVLGWLLSSTGVIAPKRRSWVMSVACGYALLAAYAVAVPAHARAGIACLAASGVTVSALAACRTRQQRRWALLGLIVISVGAAFLAFRYGRAEWFGGRRETWGAAFEMFRESPWLGIGLGNFATVYPVLRGGTVAYFAHSFWLETAAETGIVGLATLAAAIALGVWLAAPGWNRPVPAPQRSLRLGLAGSLLFAAFHGAFDHGVQIPANAYLGAIVIGILLGDIRSARIDSHWASQAGRSLSRVSLVLTIGLAGYLAYGGIREMVADRWMMPLRDAIARQRRPGKDLELDENPALLEAALPDAIRAFEMQPHQATFADSVGQAFLHLSRGQAGPELKNADDWFSRSLQLCPINPWTVKTLEEVRARLRPAETPTTDAPREREPARGPTSVRPGRWGL